MRCDPVGLLFHLINQLVDFRTQGANSCVLDDREEIRDTRVGEATLFVDDAPIDAVTAGRDKADGLAALFLEFVD